MTKDLPLTAEQEQRAQELYDRLQPVVADRMKQMCRLLAQKEDKELLGKTEFELRERAHELAARTLETALDERKKGGTKVRA